MTLKHFRLAHNSNIFNPEDRKDSTDSAHTDIEYGALTINAPEQEEKSSEKIKVEDETRDMGELPKWIGMKNHRKDWPDDERSVNRYESKSKIAEKNAIRRAKQMSDRVI